MLRIKMMKVLLINILDNHMLKKLFHLNIIEKTKAIIINKVCAKVIKKIQLKNLKFQITKFKEIKYKLLLKIMNFKILKVIQEIIMKLMSKQSRNWKKI